MFPLPLSFFRREALQTHRFLLKMSSLNLVSNEMIWWFSVDDGHIFF